ncbi:MULTISPECIES: MaoC family dehydratase [Sphingomonas]|uniref:Acyl dehydratase n=1 Tax=Sphingomonas leidyi TaxID=68569 RepID=A0A7X5V2S5_9SPHN|nr:MULTISPECIES: MaoC family dehydratase [Sphingomonas]MBN8812570.1 MaoC family dehydratase [Sphingomonas sp.]NIJ66844.1 acyl dehydratase [Sphingomonas leidyi]OJY52116.1 MAG: acyl dehydratase [Sphingomonas sp. 67-41]
MLYLDDMQVGTKRSFGRYEVTREEVLDFARRYDPQPFHLSDEAAAETHFGRLAASGWHTCAMTMSMFVAEMAVHPQASLGAAGVDELRWLKPVHPGDVLRCESEILEVKPSRSRPDMGSMRTQTTTYNQHGEPVLRFIALALMRRRPAAG